MGNSCCVHSKLPRSSCDCRTSMAADPQVAAFVAVSGSVSEVTEVGS